MKKLIVYLAAIIFALVVVVGKASAYEGSITMTGSGVSCKASSVWHESRYRVIGRCDGLVYPYQTQYEYYAVWVHDVTRDSYVRLDDIDRGYFEGDVNSAFDKLMISAEQDSGPRRPSTYTIASGTIDKFAFDKTQTAAPVESTAKNTTDTTNKTMTVQNATTKATTSATSAGSVIGRIITSLIVIIIVVVAVVIVGSLLFRKRGSVSA